jgi:hypothetical protein
LEILLDVYSKAPRFSILVMKNNERRNYIQAETIFQRSVCPSTVHAQANKGGEVTHFVIQIRYTASIVRKGCFQLRDFTRATGKFKSFKHSTTFTHNGVVCVEIHEICLYLSPSVSTPGMLKCLL